MRNREASFCPRCGRRLFRCICPEKVAPGRPQANPPRRLVLGYPQNIVLDTDAHREG